MDPNRKRLIMGNWKMNGSQAVNSSLLQGVIAGSATVLDHADLAVCVPFPYLGQAGAELRGSGITWGAQDVSEHEKGAYTGEVAASMLHDFACTWVLVGHSERRSMHGETDEQVARKAAAAVAAGLTPVVCVGETLDEQESGATESVIARQLAPVLALDEVLRHCVVAYEPVWAIGTGRSASPEQAQAVHAYIRGLLTEKEAAGQRILYGGSVKAANAPDLFAMPDIDGALVGGASLDANEFLGIAAA